MKLEAIHEELDCVTADNAKLKEVNSHLVDLTDSLREKVFVLQDDMQAIIEEHKQNGHGEVSFRDENGEYDCDFEILMMEALHLASYETAWPFIKVSYETLSGKTIIDEPVCSYQQDCIRRAGVLADLQMAIAFVEAAQLSGLHDNTTKKGKHLGGAQIRTEGVDGEVYSLGVEHLVDGTAATTFDSFLRRCQWAVEVYCVEKGKDVDEEMRALLLKLNSSLSDPVPSGDQMGEATQREEVRVDSGAARRPARG